MRLCGACNMSKPPSDFSKNQRAKGKHGQCKNCVAYGQTSIFQPETHLTESNTEISVEKGSVCSVNHGQRKNMSKQSKKEQTNKEKRDTSEKKESKRKETDSVVEGNQEIKEDSFCNVCGTLKHGGGNHNETKRHKKNEELSALAGYVSLRHTHLSRAQLKAVGVDKVVNWASPQQLASAQAVRTISQTGISMQRFRAIKPSKLTCGTDLCTEEECELASSLLDIHRSGVPNTYFDRARGRFRKFCTPAQLLAAKQCRDQCTEKIVDTGLEPSRFSHLGIKGSFCTPAEVETAAALMDASKVAPDALLRIPLRCYFHLRSDDYYAYDSSSYTSDSSGLEDDNKGKNRKKPHKPIWVTPQQHQQASDQWDAEGIAYDIDTQWGEIPYGGAYSDSLHYPSDGMGGYLGQGYGY